jgi:hypothetical protein
MTNLQLQARQSWWVPAYIGAVKALLVIMAPFMTQDHMDRFARFVANTIGRYGFKVVAVPTGTETI